MHHEDGFSIVELLLALLLTATVTATIFALLHPASAVFPAQTETSDLQQRLRVAADTLHRELASVGSGASRGALAGPLVSRFAPVLPYRVVSNADPPGSFKTDTVTLIYVPDGAAEVMTDTPMAAVSGAVAVHTADGCAPVGLLCGFANGMNVLLYDDVGSFELFTVTGANGSSLTLQHGSADSTYVYQPGSALVQVVSRTYYLRRDPVMNADQLMRADGNGGPDVPVVDHVVGLTFEYYGDPQPPALHGASLGLAAAWTTYGPKPPPLGVQTTAYPPGENCVFLEDGTSTPAPRIGTLGAGGPTLARLTAAQLTDGPWCPSPLHPGRFDADLLRVRRIGVTVRTQSGTAERRGPAGALFTHGGTARSALGLVPDLEARFQVAPRNLNLGR